MTEFRLAELTDDHIEGFRQCVGLVARERRYLGMVDVGPIEGTRAFVESVRAGNGVHLVVLDALGAVVGWCDISRPMIEGFRHTGRLGMGLLPHVRGKGVGRQLAQRALDLARERGVERVELEVFATNTRAIRLYERLGFVHEGVRRRARKLDGQYDDNVLMGLVFEP